MKSANNTAVTCPTGERLSQRLTKKKRARQKKKEKKESVGVRTMRPRQRSWQAAVEQLTGPPDEHSCVIKHPAQLVHSEVEINQSQLINFFFFFPPSPKRFVSLPFWHVSAFALTSPCEAFVSSDVHQNEKGEDTVGARRKTYGFH